MKRSVLFFLLAGSLFGGVFDGVYSTKKGDIRIRQNEAYVDFILLASGGGSMSSACDISGRAVLQSQTVAIFQTASDTGGCVAMLDFSNIGSVTLKSRGCQMFCTDRSSFDGEYKRTK